MFDELDKRNLPDKGVDFRNLKPHFIIGGDETGLQACSNGQIKVLGDVHKPKHEKIADDSRCSVTLLRIGSTGGSTGPTIF